MLKTFSVQKAVPPWNPQRSSALDTTRGYKIRPAPNLKHCDINTHNYVYFLKLKAYRGQALIYYLINVKSLQRPGGFAPWNPQN